MILKPSVLREITETLFPSDIKCAICGREIVPTRYGLCDECKLEINNNYCLRCGRHKVGIGDYCGECSELVLYFDEARSAVNYDGNAKVLVRRLKFGNAAYLAHMFVQHMLDIILVSDWDIDCVTYVPLHKSGKKKRGYNQAELIARELAEKIDIRCEDLLDKVKSTPNQAKLNRDMRLENPKGAFAVKQIPPEHVLLIDDVLTTGSTASECSRVLKKAGAKVVYVLTFASVPERPLLDKHVQNIADFRR